MLNTRLIPTPLVEASTGPAITIAVQEEPQRFRPLYIVLRLLGFFFTLFGLHVSGRRTPEVTAQRLRALLEELGGLWIKAGQLMSLRGDLFSEPVCRELSQLQYRAIGFPAELARTIIETELGYPLERVFASFDAFPFAAASISQVHRAVLRYNRVHVVVKVQRPDVQQLFQRDLALLRRLVRLFIVLRILPYMRLHDALWELEQIVNEETDYRYEMSNLQRLKKTLKTHKIYIPRVFTRYSTQRILVMEYIDGVLMSDFIAVQEQNPPRLAAWLHTNNIDPKRVGTRLFVSAMRQLFEDNLFHADLHPGNIVLLRDSRVALIDLGSIGTIPRQFLQVYMRGMSALAAGDFERAVDYTLHLSVNLTGRNLPEMREQLVRCYREWEALTHLTQLPYHDKSLAAVGVKVSKILAAYKVQQSWALMKIGRTWTTLDASLNYLIPNADYVRLFRVYQRQAERRARQWTNIYHRLRDMTHAVSETIQEYNLLLAPAIRRRTLMFQGVRTRIYHALALIVRAFSLGVVIAGIYVVFAFLYQHHSDYDLIKYIVRIDLIREIIDDIPLIDRAWWVLILISTVVIYRLCRRLIKAFEGEEFGG
jgi:ubiquinone biosynthesis protein